MDITANTEAPSRFPTFSRFSRRWFNRRVAGRLSVTLAALATVVTLIFTEENWRGRHAWLQYSRTLEAQGEKLDLKDFIPAPVPDAQNFSMTPFLAPLFDFNPKPLKPGQSNWRDTNGYNLAVSISAGWTVDKRSLDIHRLPKTGAFEMTDLSAWADAIAGVTNVTATEAAASILLALDKYSPVLDEIRAASQRRYARFNIRYNDDFAPAILVPHLAVLKTVVSQLQLRASAELVVGRTDEAWQDIKTMLYISDSIKDEPFLISKLVQLGMVNASIGPIWEGLAQQKWPEAQLNEIQQRLGRIALLRNATLRGERALDLITVEQLRTRHELIRETGPGDNVEPAVAIASIVPSGWFYQNQLFIARMFQDYLLPVVDESAQRVFPAQVKRNGAIFDRELAGGFGPYRILARLLLPSLISIELRFAHGQTQVNQAAIACALERYRLSKGQFPENLDALRSGFMQAIPHDVVNGEPLKYRRSEDGRFILYSVGWNETDDGGTVTMTKDKAPHVNLNEGDWVWGYQVK